MKERDKSLRRDVKSRGDNVPIRDVTEWASYITPFIGINTGKAGLPVGCYITLTPSTFRIQEIFLKVYLLTIHSGAGASQGHY